MDMVLDELRRVVLKPQYIHRLREDPRLGIIVNILHYKG